MGIKVEQLSKSFRSRFALKSVTFEIPDGSVAALIGENGAGKSTLLHIMAGLVRADSGTLSVGSTPPTQEQGWLCEIGFVDQEASLIGSWPLEKHSKVAEGMNLKWNETKLMERLHQLNIPEDRPVKVLSGGQRQAAATLLALAKEPKTLLLDEPLASLDPLMRRELLGILLSHAYDNKATVLLSSHLVNDIERACDHVVLLSKGLVLLSQTTEHLLNNHRWSSNSVQNKELVEADPALYAIEVGSNLLVYSSEPKVFEQMETRSAGLEEIILARMAEGTRKQPPMTEGAAR